LAKKQKIKEGGERWETKKSVVSKSKQEKINIKKKMARSRILSTVTFLFINHSLVLLISSSHLSLIITKLQHLLFPSEFL